ncbi:hypothetical protein [Thermus phage TSP4]|nr:hypothetical protein [Thermus phage TSP4]
MIPRTMASTSCHSIVHLQWNRKKGGITPPFPLPEFFPPVTGSSKTLHPLLGGCGEPENRIPGVLPPGPDPKYFLPLPVYKDQLIVAHHKRIIQNLCR